MSLPFHIHCYRISPHDHSDNATFASPLTDHTSTSSAQHAPTRFAIEDEHHRFSNIPEYYWFTDLDFQSLRKLFCPKHIQWFSPQSLLVGDAGTHTHSPFLTCFVFDHHWHAAFYQPETMLGTASNTTLFVSPSSYSHEGLLEYITPYLPASVFRYEFVPDTTIGLCGPALLQALINTFIFRLRPSYEDRFDPIILLTFHKRHFSNKHMTFDVNTLDTISFASIAQEDLPPTHPHLHLPPLQTSPCPRN